jgi:short-subunit dehydrogenase
MKNTSTALITGASSGIGLEFARIHAEKGGNTVIVARSEQKLIELKKELEEKHSGQVHIVVEDLSIPGAAQRVFAATEELGLKVDTLINNAGFGGHGLFHKRELESDLAMIQVNISALTELTHLYLQGMVSRGEGKILNVSSTASFMPGPLQAVYYATKAFVTSFSEAIAEELKDSNVTVTALCPGAVKTGFVEAGDLEGVAIFDKAKSARSVAEIGYAAMEQGKLVAFNESTLKFLLTWIVPLLPRKLVLRLSRQAMEKETNTRKLATSK